MQASLGHLAHLVKTVKQASLVNQVLMAFQDSKAILVTKVLLDFQALKVNLDLLASQEVKDSLGHQVEVGTQADQEL